MTMAEDLYCEPCRKFLCGKVTIGYYREENSIKTVSFEHHDSFESFDKAMKLPCAMCTKAWSMTTALPTVRNWKPLNGTYHLFKGQRILYFYPVGTFEADARSLELFFEPWEREYQITDRLPLSTQSNDAIDFLVNKYQECRTTHEGCNNTLRVGTGHYPSRLLDIGIDEHDLVILRSTRMFHDEEYACLSHCWGDANVLRLDAKTQTSLATGINTTLLPKTFQEAIVVTRRLHIQYLWIDSLCILQDSATDWETESARMGHIYSRAACTIAATASRNSNGGLFFDRDPRTIVPLRVDLQSSPSAAWGKGRQLGSFLCDVQNMVHHCIEEAPLNSRAWVSQERQLSRRILHFSDTQLFWECNGFIACETHPKGVLEPARTYKFHDPTLLKKALHDIMLQVSGSSEMNSVSQLKKQGLDPHTYDAWCSFRTRYLACNLTRESDKLVALHGITQQISDLTGDSFIAGLWRSRFIQELCWCKRENTPTTIPWRAPTWSWASSNHQIAGSPLPAYHGQHRSHCFAAELDGINISAKRSGELEEASIDMKCKPVPAILERHPKMRMKGRHSNGLLTLTGHGLEALEVWEVLGGIIQGLTFAIDDPDLDDRVHGYVIILQMCVHAQDKPAHEHVDRSDQEEEEEEEEEEEDSAKLDMMEALFLQRQPGVEGYFARVGLLRARGDVLVQKFLKAHRSTESQVITLV